ncbi:phosphate-starvation-inducible PsiE family protein [Archaeoglobus veneficus]|uniref:Phosphate-starvation-inducible E-like protein n=1 Tax=Archaeoglobus veneficus (strain DSM 11195 / SNP6) TaxID=693661 RepID=F2KQY6_ARCVS|nr:phosphate-starvation-inducible PsiE family protein [Archaeoglobus veneficus]AEA47792.1 hypothetical protein Arcve_1796 [Archaeoglobus veneficus SNP6]
MERQDKKYRILNSMYEAVVYVMAVVMFFLLIGNVYTILRQLPETILTGDKHLFDTMITQVLTFFVLIELIRAFTEYLEFRRVRLYIMAELAAIFVLREILIMLYAQELDWLKLLSISVLLVSVAVVRTLAIIHTPAKR